MPLPATRLREFHRIVLGANLGFLPFVLFYLVEKQTIQIEVLFVLWGLTTWIIVSEWWYLEDVFKIYQSDSVWLFVLNFIYLFMLIFLPVALLIGMVQPTQIKPFNGLSFYVYVLAALSLVDIPRSIFYLNCTSDGARKAECAANAVFDVFFMIFYLGFVWLIIPRSMPLLFISLLLGAFYTFEFVLDYFLSPLLAKKFR